MERQGVLRLILALMGGVVAFRVAAVLLASYPSIWDDAYMYVRYADNLLADGVVAWNPGGPATWGLTSLLYLVVVAPVRVLVAENVSLAALLSSLASGVLFVGLMSALVLRHVDASRTTRAVLLLGLFWMLAITLDHSSHLRAGGARTVFILDNHLVTHFVNGMDTMFVLAFLTLYILAAKAWERSGAVRAAILWGLVGGVAFVARPDLLVYALLVPMSAMLLGRDRATRRGAAIASVVTLAVVGLEVAVATLYFKSPVPLPFFVKGLHGYGDGLGRVYHQRPAIELSAFVVSYWYLFLIIGAAVVWHVVQRRRPESGVDAGLLAATVVFLAYYLFFVLQIMGYDQRFYYPTLPALVLLGAQGAALLTRELPEAAREHWQRFTAAVPRFHAGVAILVLLGTLMPLAPVARDVVERLRRGDAQFLRGTATDNYRAHQQYRWFALDRFSGLPDDLVIASTEVGLLAAMNPDKQIIDMAGLNDRAFSTVGFSAAKLLDEYGPDLLYMPHEDYAVMIRQIEECPTFQSAYEYFPREVLGGDYRMGVALKRDGAHFEELRGIVEGVRGAGGRVVGW